MRPRQVLNFRLMFIKRKYEQLKNTWKRTIIAKRRRIKFKRALLSFLYYVLRLILKVGIIIIEKINAAMKCTKRFFSEITVK